MILILLVAMWPAMTWAQPGFITVETGVSGTHSAIRVVARRAGVAIIAEARILVHGSYEAFIVELGQRRGNPITLIQAITGASVLDFEPGRRTASFCTGAGTCTGPHLGTLFFTRTAFEAAANSGLSVELVGPDGAFSAALPPELFAEARNAAAWLN